MKIQIVNKMLNDFPHLQGIKGIKQFFLNDLHIKMERKDLKGDFDWFDKMNEKGWKPCMDAHRENRNIKMDTGRAHAHQLKAA